MVHSSLRSGAPAWPWSELAGRSRLIPWSERRTIDACLFPFPFAAPWPPNSGKVKKGTAFGKREPMRDLWTAIGPLAKRRCRNETAPFRFEPFTPIERIHIADIGDRRLAEIWRRRKAPAHHGKLAFAIPRGVNDGRQAIGINRKQRGEIAGPVAHHAEGAAYRILAAGQAVEIAHWLPANGSLGMLGKATPGAGPILVIARES